MEEEYFSESVREKLIIAGADEISRHGLTNFSLRRVAAACNISCAAPYKHFKNKEELILEIIRHINRQWELLCGQILTLFENDPRHRLTEVCVAYVRFWVANPNYRSILSISEKEMNSVGHTESNVTLLKMTVCAVNKNVCCVVVTVLHRVNRNAYSTEALRFYKPYLDAHTAAHVFVGVKLNGCLEIRNTALYGCVACNVGYNALIHSIN